MSLKDQNPLPDASFDGQLLDLHLGLLTPEAEAELRRRVDLDPRLARESATLADVFAALRLERQSPKVSATPGLAARCCAAVATATGVRIVRRSADEGLIPLIRMQSLRDVIAVAAMIVLAIGVGVPGLLHMRERSQRTLCSGNLAALGQGLQAYATTFGDSVPTVGWNAASSWRPTQQPNVQLVPNRKHLVPLLTGRFVPLTRLFICPSTSDVPASLEQTLRTGDFLEPRNISYASQNMAGSQPRMHDSPDLPFVADDNPLFQNGLPSLLALSDPGTRNSPSHGGSGQNVLSLGGVVRWASHPNVGINGDNIWTLQGAPEYSGREGPLTATDAHLIK